MPEPKLYCASCGTAVDGRSAYCQACGKPIVRPLGATPPAAAPRPAPTAPPPPAPARVRRRTRLPLVLALLVVAALLVSLLASAIGGLLRSGGTVGRTGRLDAGAERLVASGDIDGSGGTVEVSGTSTTLDGLAIAVPAGAYPDGATLEVRAADVTKHTFGALFRPASPILVIDGAHAFAEAPMTVRIPIDAAPDEFAMAFFFDPAAGTLEGIPTVSREDGFLTVVTRHFSEIVVGKAQYAELDALVRKAPVDSGFRPGEDDLFAPNYGSWAEPGGHCAGQSIAMLYYYDFLRSTKKPLRANPDIDDGPYAATPDLYWDDATAYRLCSLVHRQYVAGWSRAYDAYRDADEERTYYTFLYAIHLTGLPQYVHISTTDQKSAHAMVVYAVTKDGLRICDPNEPGDVDRSIPAERTLDAALEREKVSLGSYRSRPNAKGVETTYPWISYYGAFALVDKAVLADDWTKTLAGSDPAKGIFPTGLSFVAATDRTSDGKIVATAMVPGGTARASRSGLEAVDAGSGAALYLAPKVRTLGMKLTFYRGDQVVGTTSNASQAEDLWYSVPLSPGRNDLGILYEDTDANGDLGFVDFYRFSVDYAPAGTPEATPTPAGTAAAAAYTGAWEFTELQVVGYTGMNQAFRDGIVHDGGDPGKWVLYQISDFNDLLMGAKDLKNSGAAEIRMGPPPKEAGAAWVGADVYFQTNSNHYIGNFDVVADGKRQNYRQTTLPAALQQDGSLRVAGFEGCGGLDDDDMKMDLVLSPSGEGLLSATGTATINAHDGGRIVVSFTGTLHRKSRNPGLVPEYGN